MDDLESLPDMTKEHHKHYERAVFSSRPRASSQYLLLCIANVYIYTLQSHYNSSGKRHTHTYTKGLEAQESHHVTSVCDIDNESSGTNPHHA